MFLIPLIVEFIRQRKKMSAVIDDEINTEPSNLFQDRIRLLWSRIKDEIRTFNIFRNPEKKTTYDLTNEYYATRLLILCFTIFMVILIIYTTLTTVIITVKVKQPTSSVFLQQLYPKYNQTLNCPCTQISIKYKEFISFQPTFHQLRADEFISLFQETTIKSFQNSLKLISETTQGNALATNLMLVLDNSSHQSLPASPSCINSNTGK
ncbi:unnamed protein product, partial [Didymodactylos carnosus]